MPRSAPDDLIVEIGGGTGVLTQALLRAGAVVIAIERDPVLAAGLRRRFKDAEVVTGDAAAHAWPEAPFAVVANLPFAGSGAILAHLFRDPRLRLRRAEVIVQWEFAGEARRGLARDVALDLLACVARHGDRSPPRPDGFRSSAHRRRAVLRFTRRRPRVPPELHDAYWSFLTAVFASRGPIRSALRPLLSPLQVKRLAPVLGFRPDAHARDLDAGQWARLFTAARAR